MRNQFARTLALLGCTIGIVQVTAYAATPAAKHTIIISIDGLHQDDLTCPALQQLLPHLAMLESTGISYPQAMSLAPADSFPGTFAYLTGAGPATTGVYFDDTYCRSLAAPDSQAGMLGVEFKNTEAIDRDATLLDGGGDCGLESLDPAKLPRDPLHGDRPVYPHSYLNVNTIFELAHAAGMRTSMIDKHPAYEMAAGPSGKGVDDLYCPEIKAMSAIIDGKLVDASSAPAGTKLKRITKSVDLVLAYDDLKFSALLHELHGQNARGTAPAPVPALVAINLQAVNVAQKRAGNFQDGAGQESPTPGFTAALKHIDEELAALQQTLQETGLWNDTLVVVTAKHGESPRLGDVHAVSPALLKDAMAAAGVELAVATLDGSAIIWLKEPAQIDRAVTIARTLKSQSTAFDRILFGDSLAAAGFAGAADRTPDLILTMYPGYAFIEKATKRAEHGGFSVDDLHVPLILTGGAVNGSMRGKVIATPVKTTQIAITVLQSLGLDPASLQGAQIEKTAPLPESGF